MDSLPITKDTLDSRYGSDSARWQAVQQRDPAADGAFFYAVRTTGVYCRPSCAARLARRENVRFYASAEEAQAAGFRPCKRCRPDAASLAERHAALVAGACRRIEESEETPDLSALARDAGMSPFHFHRIFRAVTGVTPKQYAQSVRARRMRVMTGTSAISTMVSHTRCAHPRSAAALLLTGLATTSSAPAPIARNDRSTWRSSA